MSVGAVIAIIGLLAQVYQVDAGQLRCMIQRESDYNVAAVNGVNVGLAQWNPDTRDWLGELARGDPAWLHGGIGDGPVYDVALMAHSIKRGYGSHWATYEGCGGGG